MEIQGPGSTTGKAGLYSKIQANNIRSPMAYYTAIADYRNEFFTVQCGSKYWHRR